MAHECPVCGQWCHCGGDIDDCGNNFPLDQANCTHCPDPWDDDLERRDEYMDDEYCADCGRPSHACMNGLCPMCFELTGGVGHGR